MVAFCAGMLDAIGVLGLVGLLDIAGYLLKEGSNVELSAYAVNPVYWLAVRCAGWVYGVLADRNFFHSLNQLRAVTCVMGCCLAMAFAAVSATVNLGITESSQAKTSVFMARFSVCLACAAIFAIALRAAASALIGSDLQSFSVSSSADVHMWFPCAIDKAS